jgi:hypothetical protein
MIPSDEVRIPHTIYFDANSLIKAGDRIDKQWIVDLRANAAMYHVTLAVPATALDEWVEYLAREGLTALNNLRVGAKRVGVLMGRGPLAFEEIPLAEFRKALREAHEKRVSDAGFDVLPLPQLDVATLVSEAVRGTAPFQSPDKGFRDAVILETIRAHADTQKKYRRIMIVSEDTQFIRGIQRITVLGITVESASPDDVLAKFMEGVDATAQAIAEEESKKALEFLNQHKDKVFERVRREEVTGWSLMYGQSILEQATILAVNNVRPIAIQDARPGFALFSNAVPEGRYPITYYVDIELDLTVKRPSLSWAFGGPRIKLETREIEEGPSMFDASRYVTEDITVKHSLSQYVTVIETGNPEAPYEDLQFPVKSRSQVDRSP